MERLFVACRRVGIVVYFSAAVGFPCAGLAQTAPPRPAAHGASPAVSPDGRLIAFVSDRGGAEDLYVMATDGSNTRQLTTGGHKTRPHWLADGHRLAFSVADKDVVHVYAVALDGTAPVEIAKLEARGGPIPLRDGARFVYGVGSWAEMQLVASAADGTHTVPLTADHAAYWCPALSPSGDRVAVGRKDANGMQVWNVKLDGSGGQQVTHFTKEQGSPQCPAYSPDGRLAVQSDVDDPAHLGRHIGHIWIVGPQGEASKLAPHEQPYVDELPDWFPDGRHLAFQSDRTGQWEIWRMNADGTGVRQLTR